MSDDARNKVVVIIEDDLDIRSLLEVILSQAGFDTESAGTGAEGIQTVRRANPDVIVLDIGLPDIDGFTVLRKIREFSQSFIVVLSAHDDEIDVLHGLSVGADGYITKPFRPRELRARIEALVRRSVTMPDLAGHESTSTVPVAAVDSTPQTPPQATQSREFAHNGLHVDIDVRAISVDGDEVTLTRSEFELLSRLVTAGRRVLSKGDLALALRADDDSSSDYVSHADRRTVEAHVGNLRRKLGDLAEVRRFIETVRGVGYRLTEPQ
ncbi:response regulator transcription factor [Paramicrobacterium fandaimingii]|uniref:response regulator transcription factor n=1 Tax=Paramicrobacterium fandaimingii TaxID=2708079 RepID=UPI001422CF0B|nr:response regulator transcription factor [Microbacterium fandaimingii]